MFSKRTNIILAIALVAFLAILVIQYNMNPNTHFEVVFEPESYAFTMSSSIGMGITVDFENADGIILTSDYGYFINSNTDDAVFREGYSVKIAPGGKVYFIPEKIEAGETVNNAIIVTATRGISETLGSVTLSISQSEDMVFTGKVFELPR